MLLTACGSMMMGSSPAMMSNGVMVAPNGMTLYTWDRDTVGGGKSGCNAQCATLWPAYFAPNAASDSGDYTIITRDDGARQYAYKGKPLYYFSRDTKPGEMTGDGFANNIWHVVK